MNKSKVIIGVILILIVSVIGIKLINNKKDNNKKIEEKQVEEKQQTMNAVFSNENTKLQLYMDGTFNYKSNGITKLGSYVVDNTTLVLNIMYKVDNNQIIPEQEVRYFVSDQITASLIDKTNPNNQESIKLIDSEVNIEESPVYIINNINK